MAWHIELVGGFCDGQHAEIDGPAEMVAVPLHRSGGFQTVLDPTPPPSEAHIATALHPTTPPSEERTATLLYRSTGKIRDGRLIYRFEREIQP